MLALLMLLAAAPEPPDTSAILRLIGRFGAGHACPIEAEVALTAAHVPDVSPLDREVPLWPYRFEGGGTVGVVEPQGVMSAVDLAVMRPQQPFARWYKRASEPPAVGERLWLLAYDWRSRKAIYADRVMSGRVLRVVAGHIMLDEEVPGGASGSCVLNEAGDVVGVVTWGQRTEDQRTAAVAAAVFGEWWGGAATRAVPPPVE